MSKTDAYEVLILAHKWKLEGKYRNVCERGECMVCKMEKVWDEWIMESHEFKRCVQWLPREMVEDVAGLCIA